LRQYIDDKIWKEIFKMLHSEYKYIEISKLVWEIWTNVVKTTCKQTSDDQLKKEIKDYLNNFKSKNDNNDNQEDLFLEICKFN
ncbi:14265_t:CDS:2, partial [Entrophospora sp. SA101]